MRAPAAVPGLAHGGGPRARGDARAGGAGRAGGGAGRGRRPRALAAARALPVSLLDIAYYISFYNFSTFLFFK